MHLSVFVCDYQDYRFWCGKFAGADIVVKLVRCTSREMGKLELLCSEPELCVVPVLLLKKRVYLDWDAIVMPRLTMLSDLVEKARNGDASAPDLLVEGINALVEVSKAESGRQGSAEHLSCLDMVCSLLEVCNHRCACGL